MSDAFDSDTASLMASVLHQALSRLKTLRLIDGDAGAAAADLSRSIIAAVQQGERNEENLVLYAIGRFQSHRDDIAQTSGP